MSLRVAFTVVLFIGLLVGCGASVRPMEETALLAAELPADAPLAGVVRPADTAALLAALGERSDALGLRLRRRGLPRALDPALLAGLGLDPDRALAFAVRSGPRLALLRSADDLERLLGTDAAAFDAWIEAHPPPPAWLHVRAVGHAISGDPVAALESRFGGLQVVQPGESPAAALEGDPGRALPEGATLYRLLSTEAPAAVVRRRAGDRVVIDLLVDQNLGAGGLAAGFAALDAPDTPVPEAHRPRAPLAADALARLHLSHERWGLTIRALGEVVALRAALDRPPGIERGRMYAVARAAARRPAQLMEPGAPAFDHSGVHLRRRGPHRDGRGRAGYTPVGRALAALRGGVSPVGHQAARRLGGTTVSVSVAPGWRAVADAVVDPPPIEAGRFLAAALQCGPVCYPALWTAAPSLALVAEQAGVALFPTLARLKSALPTSGGLDLVRTPNGAAAAVHFARPATAIRGLWGGLGGGGLVKRWVERPDGVVAVIGDDPVAVESLARGGATVARPILQTTAELTPEESSALSRFEATLGFGDDALEIECSMRLRPVPGE